MNNTTIKEGMEGIIFVADQLDTNICPAQEAIEKIVNSEGMEQHPLHSNFMQIKDKINNLMCDIANLEELARTVKDNL